MAVPDAMRLLTDEAMQRVQANLVAHCRSEGNRFAILDAPSGLDPSMTRDPSLESTLVGWRDRVAPGCEQPANAALYFPWLKVRDAISGGARLVPPCGHIAGIFARSDAGEGVFKAPANEEVQEALDLEFPVDSDTQNALNPVGINCMRALPGRGLRVWGARTLSTDPNWRYIQVRRLFLTLQRWLDQNLAWAAFEPNSPRLWNRIERDLNLHLGQLWRRGALKGSSASEAYYVKCDAETNPTETRDQGHVVTEIGLAPAWPAEFIVVRVTQRPGSTEFDQ